MGAGNRERVGQEAPATERWPLDAIVTESAPPSGPAWLTDARVMRSARWLLLALVYAIVAACVLQAFMWRWGFRGDHANFGFEPMMTYTAQRPFAYRVLVPAAVNATTKVVAPRIGDAQAEWLVDRSPLLRFRDADETWDLEKSTKWHVAYLLLFGCLWLIPFVARALTKAIYDMRAGMTDFAPAIALLFLPLTFLHGGYLYDFPELLLALLCTLCLARGWWVPFYPCFILAVFNKESNLLLVPYTLAFMHARLPRSRLAAHLVVQTAIGLAIVIGLRVAFADNPGTPVHWKLTKNLAFWLNPQSYVLTFAPYAPLIRFPRGANVLSLGLMVFLLGWGWARKPQEVRYLLVLTAACNLPLSFLLGHLDEFRNLGLMFPAIYLAAVHTVSGMYARLDGAAAEHSPPP